MSMYEKKRPPPQAFKGTTEYRIETAIRNIATKLFDHARKQFSASDLMHLFLEPQYHGPMQIAFGENHGGDLSQHLYVSLIPWSVEDVETAGFIEFQWTWRDVPDGFFPRFMHGGSSVHPCMNVLKSPHVGLQCAFIDVAQKMARISYEWGLIMKVFRELNQPGYCATPQQMRYVWPPILPILKHTNAEDDWVRILQHASPRAGDKARVPLAVQPVLRESYQIMTRALLIIENPVDPKMGPITYNVAQPKFRRHGLEFEGITAY